MALYDQFRDRVNEAVREFCAAGLGQFRSKDIADWLVRNHPDDMERFAPSFNSMLTGVVSDADAKLERIPGKYLYRSRHQPAAAPTPVTQPPASVDSREQAGDDVSATRVAREAKLYPAVRDWLSSRGYRTQVTASLKRGRQWGNPDVTGLKLNSLPLGQFSTEVATAEVKLSAADWRYWFFEAVSHKRFAHRAWFAFAVGTDEPNLAQLDEANEMCEYAERYRVGLLVLFVPAGVHDRLCGPEAGALTLGPDDLSPEVLWPAIYEPVHAPALSDFTTRVLGLASPDDLVSFGR